MNNKFILSIAICFLIALSIASVSAFVTGVNIASSFSANPGETVSGTFTIVNDATSNLSNVVCRITAFGATSSVSCPSDIAAGASPAVSFSVAVPQGQAPGSSPLVINVSGRYNWVYPFTNIANSVINVNSYPRLETSWVNAPRNINKGENQTVSYNITNKGNVDINANLSVSAPGINTFEVISLPVGSSVIKTFTIYTNSSTDYGSNQVLISAADLLSSNIFSLSGAFEVIYPYCKTSNRTTSPIRFVEIRNRDKIDGEEYAPLDEFTIKVRVQNIDDDSQDAVISAVLVKGNDIIDDSEVEETVEIEEDDYANVELKMKIPADIDEGTYKLYIKVENDDKSSNCDQKYLTINIEKNEHELSIEDLKYPAIASCGSYNTVEGILYNIGSADQEKVKIVFSDDFGNSFEEIYNDFDSGDDAYLSYNLNVPKNATEGTHTFKFTLYYKYDDDKNKYRADSVVTKSYKVSGNCKPIVAGEMITTEASTAIIGTQSEIRFTLTNRALSSQDYVISATADWADGITVTPSSTTLASGENEQIIVKLTPKSGTSIGVHNLNVNVQYGASSESKTIPVTVQKSSTSSNLLDQIMFSLRYNPTWIVIDAILVIAIIIVIVLIVLSKKKHN